MCALLGQNDCLGTLLESLAGTRCHTGRRAHGGWGSGSWGEDRQCDESGERLAAWLPQGRGATARPARGGVLVVVVGVGACAVRAYMCTRV